MYTYADIDSLPDRKSFLVERDLGELKELIMFMSTSLEQRNLNLGSGKPTYTILLHGVDLKGEATMLALTGFRPYIAVRATAASPIDKLREEFNEFTSSFEVKKGKPFQYYQLEEDEFLYMYFSTLKERQAALKYASNYHRNDLFCDDGSCYERVFLRDTFIQMGAWIEVSSYTLMKHMFYKSPIMVTDYKNVRNTSYDIMLYKPLREDRSIVCYWDIETWSHDGDLPNASRKQDCIFMISLVFAYHFSSEPLVSYCITDCEQKPSNYTVVLCENDKEILLAMARIIGLMKPQYMVAFNDFKYDQPWIIERGKQHGILEDMYNYMSESKITDIKSFEDYVVRKENIKMEAGLNDDGCFLNIPSLMMVDMRFVMRLLFPKDEDTSLNHFLEKGRLGKKKDMPIHDMFRLYANYKDLKKKGERISHLLDETKLVGDYCVYDAQALQSLMIKYNIINDKREMANMSYTKIYDAYYRANGVKVYNLTVAIGQQFGLIFHSRVTTEERKGKFPGAYVISPLKGTHVSKLSLDEIRKRANDIKDNKNASRIYETGAEVINDEEMTAAKEFIKSSGKAVFSEEEIGNNWSKPVAEFLKRQTGRPIIGFDFKSLYPSLIMTYNFSPEMTIDHKNKKFAVALSAKGVKLNRIEFPFDGQLIKAYTVSHENDLKNKFGLYPRVLKNLMDLRAKYKSALKSAQKEKEKLEKNNESKDKIGSVAYAILYYTSKSNAVKVFMNTFYGVLGDKFSPLHMLCLAGGTTSAGRYNLRLAISFLAKNDCKIYYGDTDSCYLSIAERYFTELDTTYYSGQITKLEYWTAMVRKTQEIAAPLLKSINQHFVEENGTHFLEMDYEEVLYPTAFFAKKKYAGLPHIEHVNFNCDMFIRGLDLMKRGVPNIMRELCNQALKQVFSIDNNMSMMEIVHSRIEYLYQNEWKIEDFALSGKYKPKVQNIPMKTFYHRMVEAGIPIVPFEKFDYVVVKKHAYNYDIRGRIEKLGKGDRMELLSEATSRGLTIDINAYVTGSIVGQFARFICYHPQFNPEDNNTDGFLTDEELDAIEKAIVKRAKDYIKQFISGYSGDEVKYDKVYKNIFKGVNKMLQNSLMQTKSSSPIIKLMFMSYDIAEFDKWIMTKIETDIAKIDVVQEAKNKVNSVLDKSRIKEHLKEMYSVCLENDKTIEEIELTIKQKRMELNGKMDSYRKIFGIHDKFLTAYVKHIRKELGIDNLDKIDEKTERMLEEGTLEFDLEEYREELQNKFAERMNRKESTSILEDFNLRYNNILSLHKRVKFLQHVKDYVCELCEDYSVRKILVSKKQAKEYAESADFGIKLDE